jgi:hypothetical protein
MRAKLGRRASIAAAIMFIAAGGSVAFAGTALAGGDGCGCDGPPSHHSHYEGHHGHGGGSDGQHDNRGGSGGNGGDANVNCVAPVGVSLGLVGQGGDVSQCNAVGGDGSDGGTGANY